MFFFSSFNGEGRKTGAVSRESRPSVLRTNPTAPLKQNKKKKKEKNVFQATAIAHLGIVNDPLLPTLSLNISSAFDSVCHNTLLMLPSFFREEPQKSLLTDRRVTSVISRLDFIDFIFYFLHKLIVCFRPAFTFDLLPVSW